ncbi:Cyanovirin-N [Madurella mycetomatis]|uniref:Cyanovirin-N n=1 Tax=Madurella mycetomatis TaxID=100816 RepID=A0A175VWI6_9PEZI|nr:Cyanovirin-N [Madurella mycetomatis]KXX79346.1 Cyanovirin-N [Madurella mycetomatis]
MSFHASASNIRVDDGHILRARLQKADGELVDAELDLNGCIGNSDGNFEWGGVNFSHSAEDISFEMEGDDNVPVLRASLKPLEGDPIPRDINLSERIGNNDGSFEFS